MIGKCVCSGIDFSTLRTNTFQLSRSTTVSVMSTQRRLVFISLAAFYTMMISTSARRVCNERENVVASIFERINIKMLQDKSQSQIISPHMFFCLVEKIHSQLFFLHLFETKTGKLYEKKSSFNFFLLFVIKWKEKKLFFRKLELFYLIYDFFFFQIYCFILYFPIEYLFSIQFSYFLLYWEKKIQFKKRFSIVKKILF